MVLYTIGAIAYVVMVTLYVYRFIVAKDNKRWQKLTLFTIFMALGIILFLLEGASGGALIQLILGMLIFNGMIPTYGTDINFVYIIFGIGYILLEWLLGLSFIAQAMLFGMLSEVMMMTSVKERHANRAIEVRRDMLQALFGCLFIAAFYFFSAATADVLVLSMIMLGVFLLNYAKTMHRRTFSEFIYNLERRNTALGHGALWLAMGTLIAISFLAKPYIMVVFAALFIGDSMATIIGVTYKSKKLPYNKSKSMAGTVAYFLSTFVVSYIFIGWVALPVAILAAFVESIPWKLDDNFSVSIVLVAVLLALGRL